MHVSNSPEWQREDTICHFSVTLGSSKKIREILIFVEKPGEIKICDIIVSKNIFQRSFLSCFSGKSLKIPWKSQGKPREFSFSKIWPPLILYCSSFEACQNLFILCLKISTFYVCGSILFNYIIITIIS